MIGPETSRARYIIISPVRNEEKYIEKTIQAVISQSLIPEAWILVNDGSTDRTEAIIRSYAGRYDWIRLISLADRGYGQPGGGIVEAFNQGLRGIDAAGYDFLVKLDGDVSFGVGYFEDIAGLFAANPRLGIAGGWVADFVNGRLRPHVHPANHVRGCIKAYRRECFREIGGLRPQLGWDGLDEMTAQLKGWETKSFRGIVVLHLRPMGAVGGALKAKLRDAKGACIMGYHPLFMVGRCLTRMVIDRPPILGGLTMLLGYVYFKVMAVKQVDDRRLVEFIRNQQRNRMKFWKRRTSRG
jgi:glycosyltransferase involved in cell wall biosynthesis